MTSRVHVISDPDALQAIAHPRRARILDALRQPISAAGVARIVGESRQNANYHLRELERVGLAKRVGERRKGNFIETLYQAAAPSFLVSPRAVWGDPSRLRALQDQASLEQLVQLGEVVERDAVALLDRAAFDGEQIASASVEAEVRFADEQSRAAFLREYLAAVGPLLRKYGRRKGEAYRVVLAAYPDPDSNPGEGSNP